MITKVIVSHSPRLVKKIQNTTALFYFLWLKDKYSVIENVFKYREPGVCILSHLVSWVHCHTPSVDKQGYSS